MKVIIAGVMLGLAAFALIGICVHLWRDYRADRRREQWVRDYVRRFHLDEQEEADLGLRKR